MQRHYPIVFSVGDNPVPIALMGLNEGVNVFLDEDGRPLDPRASTSRPISAAIRSCWRGSVPIATSCRSASTRPPNAVGEFDEGEALFDGDQPSEATKAILQFCEQFEAAGQRTAAFMEELTEVRPADGRRGRDPAGGRRSSRSSIAVSAWSTRTSCANLRGDELRKMNQNGMLPLIYAHLFSLSQMRDVFGRQMQQGKAPAQVPQPAPADA